jgi:hypothetical protein
MTTAINLPKLRNAEFIQFIKNYLIIIQANNPDTLRVQAQYDALQGMLSVLEDLFLTEQGSAITEDVSAIDTRRDRAVTGFSLMANALTYHFDPVIAKQAETIKKLVDKYGGGIARENYQAETAIIDNLVADLSKPEAVTAITALNLDGWKKEMEQANKAFNDAYLLRTQQLGAASKDKLLAKRLETNEVYYKLRNFIDSYYTINEGAEPYNKTTNELNALIDQYNTMMAGRVGNEKEETPVPPTA